MCRMVEQFGDERETKGEIRGKVKTVKNMLKDNIPIETALRYVQMSKKTYEKYAKQLK